MANILAHLGVYAAAIALAAALAWPAGSFLLYIFSLGLSYLLLLPVGLFALLGPLLVLVLAVLAWFRRTNRTVFWVTLNAWLCAVIVHAGAARGMSRWGEVGSTMGAQNMSYGEAFAGPLTFIFNRVR